jgi:hypothetical protein
MDEKSMAIGQIRRLLEEERHAEEVRHRFAMDYFNDQLDGLKKQCVHPSDRHHHYTGVFPEDSWTKCTICGATL